MSEFVSNITKKGKCRRIIRGKPCNAAIEGPPNKKYCDVCRKVVTKEREQAR